MPEHITEEEKAELEELLKLEEWNAEQDARVDELGEKLMAGLPMFNEVMDVLTELAA